ncbi:serine/threonine protein kinase, CMGC family, CDC2/CDK subfamily [Piedraia hortae CBS 480.64]|uniref:Serine/threonine protein kinase, CMGC family, CDC2/CDK subfamily n=1 Tax=Piedraia hortae CBS 480.64 TaxID=1314780 RepID=A0A6A7BPI5_9PEZI|nr:serine/threonine protein kinase, CMGC family, CDC2/CDK subfamily [Piedraia hortae CBS 480.64]
MEIEPPAKRLKLTPEPESSTFADLAEQRDAEERQKYIKGKKIGSGQYADVFSAHLASDPTKLFAIKKIKTGPEVQEFGISYDSLREIRFLQELHHENIIKLHSVFSTKNQNLNLVLEYLPQGDLLTLIQDNSVFYTAADIKMWMMQLGRAVYFCHGFGVLHRDIKPNNLLIASSGQIKLADFGLARKMADPFQQMTYNTITLWYRPPELFFQAQHYSGNVDIWSCGCVFAELILRDVMFRAVPQTELKMISLISERVGTPTEQNWPGVSHLKGYVVSGDVIPLRSRESWNNSFRSVGPAGVDLLIKMLTLDPRKRPTAEGVLKHEYWTSDPRPSRLEDLPRKGGGETTMAHDLAQKQDRGKVSRLIDFSKV